MHVYIIEKIYILDQSLLMQGKDSRMGSALKLGDSCTLTDAFLDFAQSSEASFIQMAATLGIQVSTTTVRPLTSAFVLAETSFRSPRNIFIFI